MRKKTIQVDVGGVKIGADAPIIVQSMTNTDTADIETTVEQIAELARAGSEIVRLTVDRNEAARAVPYIYEKLEKKGINVPLVGDFHYIGHKLLKDFPDCAKSLAKYRINPGNVGFKDKRDKQFSELVDLAIKYDKPIRIGVNWGSLDQDLLTRLMDENKNCDNPQTSKDIMIEAMVQSALLSAKRAENLGLSADKIILSAKTSNVQSLIKIYQNLSARSNYALHLGLTEAGMGSKAIVASSAALGILLQQGIGDTIRISLTPEPQADRSLEVKIARQLLQSMGFRKFTPEVAACPGCGRTSSSLFQQLAKEIEEFIAASMPEWKAKYRGIENLNIAVMGCIVNGPGESKHADIGISLPGTGETPSAPVFIEGKKAYILRGRDIGEQFKQILLNYIEQKFVN